MSRLSHLFYAVTAALLMAFAAALALSGPVLIVQALLRGESPLTPMVDALTYLILSIAVFDVAQYLFEEEVQRGREMRKASETRRSITKFITVIVIAVLMHAIVSLLKTAQGGLGHHIHPVVLIGGGAALLLTLAVFQRLSAEVEQKVGADDERAEAEDGKRRDRG